MSCKTNLSGGGGRKAITGCLCADGACGGAGGGDDGVGADAAATCQGRLVGPALASSDPLHLPEIVQPRRGLMFCCQSMKTNTLPRATVDRALHELKFVDDEVSRRGFNLYLSGGREGLGLPTLPCPRNGLGDAGRL